MPRTKRNNKKTAITETQKKRQTQKFSASEKLSDSVVARKTLSRPKSKDKKANELSLDVFDTKGEVIRSVDLPKEIFGAKINKQLLAQAVRVYLANQRKGTASTKDRGEVHGSTRKIYRQKGTGRARHGSRKAPIFVHGGIVFGPHPRDFSLKMSKKMKKLALFSALSAKLKNKEIKAIAGLENLAPKTKSMVEVINNLGIDKKKRDILMVTPGRLTSLGITEELKNVYRAARNIEGLHIANANTLNTYEVLNNKLILLMDKAIGMIKENFWKEKSSI